MNNPSLAQRRAAHALSKVNDHIGKKYGNYVSYVTALPATILMNGLGQACATLLSKAEGKLDKPHGLLYSDLNDWLCSAGHAGILSGKSDLMAAITESDEKTYLHVQAEALAYLVWLKKFANAYLEPGKPE